MSVRRVNHNYDAVVTRDRHPGLDAQYKNKGTRYYYYCCCCCGVAVTTEFCRLPSCVTISNQWDRYLYAAGAKNGPSRALGLCQTNPFSTVCSAEAVREARARTALCIPHKFKTNIYLIRSISVPTQNSNRVLIL